MISRLSVTVRSSKWVFLSYYIAVLSTLRFSGESMILYVLHSVTLSVTNYSLTSALPCPSHHVTHARRLVWFKPNLFIRRNHKLNK